MSQGRSRPTSSGSQPASIYGDLEDAICLLALVMKRPPDLDGIMVPEKGLHSTSGSLRQTLGVDLNNGPEKDHDALQVETDVGVDEVEELDDLQLIDTDRDEQQYLTELQSKILDRLAQTLARFKSDPMTKTSIDARHVSSAMMIIYQEDERVKILCSKNEGLDIEDKVFLCDWKGSMETIARKDDVNQPAASAIVLRSWQEAASEEDMTTMFNLVVNHQWRRILCYLKWLKCAFQPKEFPAHHRSKEAAALVKSRLESHPFLKTRLWTDDNGFEFSTPTNLRAEDYGLSETVATGESFENVDSSVSDLFKKVHKLCAEESRRSQEELLK
ncbi:uncharacterized protein Z519_05872 [Cladophialophora bantiana CBS 173.52]|uniref:Uncharacterized protein n=1 Tax=Cladophialophora bantiana (strain ATCC 10958 / CBS 173.52 / CDC B-1940 / NIH 8579) TaxID=1442370 RepID=A0A0D2G3L3_CLAB1|nr:uncharacterized protein Z519_05872 [Cladophialophora bantiana CBS 173.52]KIW93267.1 hypothetical protein Z519_05872 [Cladophialophora bantiana CBS 173.52]